MWFIISMVIVCASSLATILAQYMAFRVILRFVGKARPIPFHVEEFVCPSEPNSMPFLALGRSV